MYCQMEMVYRNRMYESKIGHQMYRVHYQWEVRVQNWSPIIIIIIIIRLKGFQSNDKAMVNATLQEVNPKIKNWKVSSSIKLLLTYRNPLMGKVYENVFWNEIFSLNFHQLFFYPRHLAKATYTERVA